MVTLDLPYIPRIYGLPFLSVEAEQTWLGEKLWISQEKLWIKRLAWGKLVFLFDVSFRGYPQIWEVL